MNNYVDEEENSTNVEIKAVDKESGAQQEIKISNKDTGSLRLEGAKVDVIETISERRIANEASITLKEDAPWEADSSFEAAGETKYSTPPPYRKSSIQGRHLKKLM